MSHPAPRGCLDLSSSVSGPATYERRSDGYCRWRSWEPSEGRERYVYVHQLLAIADGADPYRVFTGGEHTVHHCNGTRWDNRLERREAGGESNLELLEHAEHFGAHHAEKASAKAQQVRADGGNR